ncbi:Trehalase [Papilio xuthus]|uniref:Trehalase n=1 Tax=Papilio xuthus TaxID=66420 RepID=A0A194QAN3_PAPXU|nr:Trehalase [Papilio xuthus]
MRCLPLIDGGEDAQKENIFMPPLIRKVRFHFPSFPYKKKGGKGKRTKLGLRDAHSSDETRNCFHLTPVFCVVVVFHRASRDNSCEDVKAGSTTVKCYGCMDLAEIRHRCSSLEEYVAYIMLVPTILALATLISADELPPSCNRPVYCNSDLLHYVQTSRIYTDSKTFVDLHLKNDENKTLADFNELLEKTNRNPSKEQIKNFVDEYFQSGNEIEVWKPTDHNDNPPFLAEIRDKTLRKFAQDINSIWPTLGRKVKPIVFEKPDLYSFIPISNGFIIPGGRFTEIYYWDAYWILEGLLICGMEDTARGMIDNLIQLLKKLGHIPNGSRVYYAQRSQPPLLTAMVSLYVQKTKDLAFLKANIEALEYELEYWLETQTITFEKDGKSHTLLRYYAPSTGPRPESYYEDYTLAQQFENEERQKEFYVDIKSAAESGWDFSSRWFIGPNGENTGNLSTIHTTKIIPVDLNSIFANALQNIAYFQGLLHHGRQAAHWAYLAKQWRTTIEDVLWDNEDGIWYDYNVESGEYRKYFYPSNVAPLWMEAVDRKLLMERAPRIISYLRDSQGLDFPGGIPSSLVKSGEQWDYPNAWPPLVSVTVNALRALGTREAKQIAFDIAQKWVRACLKGFTDNKQMFEKYDVEQPGRIGGGGEYTVQAGFGWSNGVVLEMIKNYAYKMTASDSNPELSDESFSEIELSVESVEAN